MNNYQKEQQSEMGSFSVLSSFFKDSVDSVMETNTNSACFARVQYYLKLDTTINNQSFILIPLSKITELKKYLNEKSFVKLLSFINVFTPCELVTENEETYIKYVFSFNKKYDLNLFFLNFIRSYWYSPRGYSHTMFQEGILKTRKIKDKNKMMLRLTTIFKNSLRKDAYCGHSNVVKSFRPINYDHFESFENTNLASISSIF